MSTPLILLRIFRRNKFRYFQDLSNSQWLKMSEIREIQNRKFLELVNYCREKVPYYHSAIGGTDEIKSISDIVKLPFLTKEKILNNRNALKSKDSRPERFESDSTSGSTGETLKFYSDAENVVHLGILMRNNIWTGWNPGDRQAMLWGSHFDISVAKRLSSRVKNFFIYKKLLLSSFDMTKEDMLLYQERINKYKPKLITGYPSGLFAFAGFLEEKGLDIYQPNGVITSGETLYEYQKEKIESVFKCKVYNRYGCREVGNIGHECEKQNGLHINAEHVIVEVLNENGEPCNPGELGEIVITDLDNYVFPFIRYKIGDIGSLSERTCSCGRGLPLLESVEGRTFDIIVGARGNYITGNYWTILLRTLVKGIRQFQVIQEEKNELVFKLVVESLFENSEKIKLIKAVREKCGEDMKIKIDFVDQIPLTPSGKLKFVISKYSPFVKIYNHK